MNLPNNSAPKFIVFLDFDGVLHSTRASEHEKFKPEAIHSVNRILDECQWRSKSVPPGRSKSVPVGTRWFDVVLAEVRSGAARQQA